jgi:hypothetical protein
MHVTFFMENLRDDPLGRTRRRWEDGIRMDLREIGSGVWTGFIWLRIDIRPSQPATYTAHTVLARELNEEDCDGLDT